MTLFFNTALKAYSQDGTNWHSVINPLIGWSTTTITFNPNNGWATIYITVAVDDINVDAGATLLAHGTYSATTGVSTIQAVFPKANGGSGGSATTILTLTPVSSTQINAAWTAVSGATGYTLERSTTSNFGSVTTAYTGTALSFNDTGLTAGTQYYYRVKVSLVTNSAARNATPVVVVATNNAFTFTFPFNLS